MMKSTGIFSRINSLFSILVKFGQSLVKPMFDQNFTKFDQVWPNLTKIHQNHFLVETYKKKNLTWDLFGSRLIFPDFGSAPWERQWNQNPCKKGQAWKQKQKLRVLAKRTKVEREKQWKHLHQQTWEGLKKAKGKCLFKTNWRKQVRKRYWKEQKQSCRSSWPRMKKNKLWSKHQTYLKGNQDEKNTYDEAGKK